MDDHEREVQEQTGAGDYGGAPDAEETGDDARSPAGDTGPAGGSEEAGEEFERGGDGSEGSEG